MIIVQLTGFSWPRNPGSKLVFGAEIRYPSGMIKHIGGIQDPPINVEATNLLAVYRCLKMVLNYLSEKAFPHEQIEILTDIKVLVQQMEGGKINPGAHQIDAVACQNMLLFISQRIIFKFIPRAKNQRAYEITNRYITEEMREQKAA